MNKKVKFHKNNMIYKKNILIRSHIELKIILV